MRITLVGTNHRQAPIEIRERLNISEKHLPQALSRLLRMEGVGEAVLLSTCNRVEIYATTDPVRLPQAHEALVAFLADYHHLAPAQIQNYLYHKSEREAASHLLRVAAGLDSLVLGEAQILGQTREALRVAQQTESVGSVLNALFQQALASSRRIQNETGIGRGAFSIGHAAVDLANQIFADLSHASALILGAGKMSEMTVRHLVHNGVRVVVVANRTFEKAQSMAERVGGSAIHYDRFPEALATADIVIASTAAPHTILHKETLLPVVRKRRGKPLFLIDIAVPRDIDSDVADLENVFLYNIDDLQAVVSEEAQTRAGEAKRAETIAHEETEKFMTWYRQREAAPVITQLRERLESIRQEDLALLRAKLGNLSEREWEAIEIATQAMMRRVAREPILRLKREADGKEGVAGERYDLMTSAREMFNLREESPPVSPSQETPPLPSETRP